MRIQYASDLHLEVSENRKWLKEHPLIPRGEVLILAGDIIYDKFDKKARFFYEDIKEKFRAIIRVPGNHEFYRGTIDYVYPSYKKEFQGNHFKLNNQTIVIDDVRFIASILWSHIPDDEVEKYYKIMNDYRSISKLYQSIPSASRSCNELNITIRDTNAFHEISINFIENELKKAHAGKTVVITHHLPSFKFLKEQSKLEYKHSYASSLEDIIKKYPFDLWVFGHRHESFDQILHDKRFVSNPLGFPGGQQRARFKRDSCFEI